MSISNLLIIRRRWLSITGDAETPGGVPLGDGLWFETSDLNNFNLDPSNNVLGWTANGGQGGELTSNIGEELLYIPPDPQVEFVEDASPITVGFSLRLLNRDYLGNCLRIRRASDNAETDIGFVNNEIDLDAIGAFCGASDGFVTIWYDQSGNGNNATQTVNANQPKIYDGGTTLVITENNKPAIEFDGANSFLVLDSNNVYSNTNGLSIFSVLKSNVVANFDNTVGQYGLDNNRVWRLETNRAVVQTDPTNFDTSEATSSGDFDLDTNQSITTMIWGPSVPVSIYKNNVLQDTASSAVNALPSSSTDVLIGASFSGDGTTPTSFFNGLFQEVLVYDSEQSVNQRVIEVNQANYYGLDINQNNEFFPIVKGDGTKGASLTLTTPFIPREIVVIVKHNRTGVFDRVFSFGDGVNNLLEITSSSVTSEAYKLQNNNSSEQVFPITIELDQTEFNILGGVADNASSSLRFNTEQVATGTITPTLATNFNLFQRADGSNKGDYHIAEIIVYDRVLTLQERSNVQNYLIDKYFINAVLTINNELVLNQNYNIIVTDTQVLINENNEILTTENNSFLVTN